MAAELVTLNREGDIQGISLPYIDGDVHILRNILGCTFCPGYERGGSDYEFRVIHIDPASGEISLHCNAITTLSDEQAPCLVRHSDKLK